MVWNSPLSSEEDFEIKSFLISRLNINMKVKIEKKQLWMGTGKIYRAVFDGCTACMGNSSGQWDRRPRQAEFTFQGVSVNVSLKTEPREITDTESRRRHQTLL